MRYLEFEKAFRDYPIFSVRDIEKRFPGFDNRRLVEWQQKRYLLKVRRGYYCFSERKRDEFFLYFSANKMYAPSYVSLETGLAYYNLIPEGVFTTTSVTTRNTANYETPIGNFGYKHMKEILFFGYRLIRGQGFTFKIAEVEKVVLDYLYLNKVNSLEEMEGLRFNEIQARETIDFEKLSKYQRIFNSKVLDKRTGLFKKVIHA
jgi:predicted transcriptional regulator of viral defense system